MGNDTTKNGKHELWFNLNIKNLRDDKEEVGGGAKIRREDRVVWKS